MHPILKLGITTKLNALHKAQSMGTVQWGGKICRRLRMGASSGIQCCQI